MEKELHKAKYRLTDAIFEEPEEFEVLYYAMDSLCQEKAKNLLIFINQNLGIYIKLLKRED